MSEVRLIDANALKEQFFGDYDGKTYFTNEVLKLIDNAPTVEFSKEICSACGRYIREKGGAE